MKKTNILLLFSTIFASVGISQHNRPFSTTVSNSTPTGYIGIGVKPTTSSTALAAFNLHLHGVANFTETAPAVLGGGTPPSINYGITSRFGMTNSTTGSTQSDGTLFMMAGNDFHLVNREAGSLHIGVINTTLRFHQPSSRVWLGDPTGAGHTDARFARFNITSSDNALFLQTTTLANTALRIKYLNDNGKAIEVFGTDAVNPNFKVFTSGFVYARRYITTLSNFPDYVFGDNYQLMPLSELRTYVNTHKHLPNVPTASQIEEDGADLGELNRVLVEKVEELTLYILQMEARLKELEGKK